MQIDLQELHVSYRDYDPEDNPPVLHQKGLLAQSDYPLYEKFAKLSRQEADWGYWMIWGGRAIGEGGRSVRRNTVQS
jgi:hypothetical protein